MTLQEVYDKAKETLGKDVLIVVRMGDFYELFHDDARVAAKVLELTLTSRNKNDPIPMCCFVHHQLDAYLAKLVKAGYRVAVSENSSDIVVKDSHDGEETHLCENPRCDALHHQRENRDLSCPWKAG